MSVADPITAGTVNDLLNYDVSDSDDPFNDKPSKPRDDKPNLSPRGTKRPVGEVSKQNYGLGLDEEVKIAKKRRPIAKLDEARLLSAPGIPKLRALAREGNISKKLRFKGRGHEFSDIARLLTYYQLWLDNLYPRANFADGLQLVEKVGHSKRLQVMRKEWIDEGKPGYLPKEESERMSEDVRREEAGENEAGRDGLFFPDKRVGNSDANDRDAAEPDDDDLAALLAEQETFAKTTDRQVQADDEDDLDALLAEQETRKQNVVGQTGEDEDDLDALLAEQDVRVTPAPQPAKRKSISQRDEDEVEDQDELDMLLAEQEAHETDSPASPALPTITQEAAESHEVQEQPCQEVGAAGNETTYSSSPLPNNPEEVDELDELFAEQEAQWKRTPLNKSERNNLVEEQEDAFLSSPISNTD